MNFFTRYKKFFLIIGFLIIVIGLGYLIWYLFFKAATITPIETTTTQEAGGLPTAGPGGEIASNTPGESGLPSGAPISSAPNPDEPSNVAIGGLTKTTALTSSPALNPTLSTNGGVQYYNQSDGHFYRIDKNGQAVLMSDQVFYNVEKVVWAPNKDRAILQYPDGNKILYDFSTKKQVTLPAHWQDFSFSPSSDQIVSKSLGLDAENRWLIVSNSDGSKATALENIGTNDKTVYPAWSPNKQVVAMYTQGVDFDRQEVYFVGLNNENFKSTMVEGRGFQAQWSTSGDRLLYSVYNSSTNMNPQLWLVDASGNSIGENRKTIGLQTWANKCTFASNTEVYCAVPETLDKGAGLFPELADKTKDNLYKINLTTGAKELVAIPNDAYNISQILVPSAKDYLYFTDKKTGQIYKIKLP